MKIVDLDFFYHKLPNLNESSNCDVRYIGHITEYEDLCLRIVLGECMYEELLEQLEFDEVLGRYKLKVDADIKWTYLLYGRKYNVSEVENLMSNFYFGSNHCGCGCYTSNCDDFYWKGLIEVFDAIGMVRDNQTHIISRRLVERKESLIADFIMFKYFVQTQSFTAGVGEIVNDSKNTTLVNNIHKAVKSYNDFVYKCITCSSRGKVGLYGYIQHFKNEYPNWAGACLEYKPLI
jgi:hypothetical protein